MIARNHYVYVHRTASDGRVFYVGKGKGRRAWSAHSRSRYWRHVAAKHGFEVAIVRDGLPERCALTLEQIVIARIGVANLANATLGGGGITGWRHSDDAKRAIGAFSKGRPFTDRMRAALEASNKNRVVTPETRERLRAAAKARPPRQPHSAETRAKIAMSHIGLRPTEEARRNMSLAKIGKAKGRASPSYDRTVRTFHHAEHGQFVGTRADFIAAFGLPDGCVSAVINGRQKSVKGWRQK